MIQTCKLGSNPELTRKRKKTEMSPIGDKKPPGEMPHRREVSLASVLERQQHSTLIVRLCKRTVVSLNSLLPLNIAWLAFSLALYLYSTLVVEVVR